MARLFFLAVLSFGLCLSQMACAAGPAVKAGTTPPQIRQTVERAFGYLQG
jgi:hypothetical protein